MRSRTTGGEKLKRSVQKGRAETPDGENARAVTAAVRDSFMLEWSVFDQY
jgi:hypothetical protein